MALSKNVSRLRVSRLTMVVAAAGIGLALAGCQNVREATGVAKLAPDEFTVITKAPLIVPPDYNLRPPQPGAADRNMSSPADQARDALFQQDPNAAATALGADYSDTERLLLSRSGGSIADPSIRNQIGIDSGRTDQGDEFAREVLYPDGGAPETPEARGAQ